MLLRLTDVTKSFGPLQVLRRATLEVARGEKIGLIGSNGSGKTTIFRIILGELEPDGGEVAAARGIRIAYMPQEVTAASALPLRSYVLEARQDIRAIEDEMRAVEHAIHEAPGDERLLRRLGDLGHAFEEKGGYRIAAECDAVLEGLGFSAAARDMPLDRMSGGERTKAALARLLLDEPDLMLLDEPTNHLDIWASTWLEGFLERSPSSAIIVSHDRYFLDRVPQKIVELALGTTTTYRGNWSASVEQREHRRRDHERRYEAQQEFIEKEEDFIRRYHYGQRAREARGRAKKLARLERLEKIERERTLSLKLAGATERSELLVRMANVSKSFGGRELFRDVDFDLVRGDRVGLIGPNGAGKTTFLRLVVGEEEPTTGEVKRGAVKLGYYDQHQRTLAPDNTVIDEIAGVCPQFTLPELRSAAGRFLFSGDDAFKPVGLLSGGERARLALAKLVFARPSFLVLDEPTNHLDIPSREAVEEALADYDGSVLLVTHDRYLLDAVVDTLLILHDGRIRMFAGDYSAWREYVEREERERAAREASERSAKPLSEAETLRRERKRLERDRRRREREREAVEREIADLEARQAEIMARFEDPATYGDPDLVRDLGTESARIKEALEAAYGRWEALETEPPIE